MAFLLSFRLKPTKDFVILSDERSEESKDLWLFLGEGHYAQISGPIHLTFCAKGTERQEGSPTLTSLP